MRRTFARLVVLLCCLSALMVPSAHAQSANPGDGTPGGSPLSTSAAPQSTVNRIDVFFVKENGKTTIAQRVCGDGAYFQLRSEAVGKWITEIFDRTVYADGCSPSAGGWYKMVLNADAGTQAFRIYATSNDRYLSEGEFMERASRRLCYVTGYGTGRCDAPEAVTVPRADVNEPGDGQTVAGTINLRGWAADLASLNGAGVNEIHVYAGDTPLGAASYGQVRGDVASVFGDGRFTNSGYTYSLDTNRIPNGPATIRVAARSTVTGQWTWFERRVTVSNQGDPIPITPTPDTTPPNGNIVTPTNNSSISPGTVKIAANASDEGGSGVKEVEIFVKYNGNWRSIGIDPDSPYEAIWTVPDGLSTQLVQFTIYVRDTAGNQTADAGGIRTVSFIASSQERAVNSRAYLNQRALGPSGNAMCSMSSIAMIRASAGLIGKDFDSLRNEANRVWNTGLRGPGPVQVANYLNSNGMRANVIWTQNKEQHWNAIKQEIDAGRPVIINPRPAAEGGKLTSVGHYIVVVGYRDNPNIAQRDLIVYDPFGGWKGSVSQYNQNTTEHDTPNSLKGRWVYYNYLSIGTIYSVVAQRATLVTAQAPDESTPDEFIPDEVYVLEAEDIVTYEGDGQQQEALPLYLPLLMR